MVNSKFLCSHFSLRNFFNFATDVMAISERLLVFFCNDRVRYDQTKWVWSWCLIPGFFSIPLSKDFADDAWKKLLSSCLSPWNLTHFPISDTNQTQTRTLPYMPPPSLCSNLDPLGYSSKLFDSVEELSHSLGWRIISRTFRYTMVEIYGWKVGHFICHLRNAPNYFLSFGSNFLYWT